MAAPLTAVRLRRVSRRRKPLQAMLIVEADERTRDGLYRCLVRLGCTGSAAPKWSPRVGPPATGGRTASTPPTMILDSLTSMGLVKGPRNVATNAGGLENETKGRTPEPAPSEVDVMPLQAIHPIRKSISTSTKGKSALFKLFEAETDDSLDSGTDAPLDKSVPSEDPASPLAEGTSEDAPVNPHAPTPAPELPPTLDGLSTVAAEYFLQPSPELTPAPALATAPSSASGPLSLKEQLLKGGGGRGRGRGNRGRGRGR